jgi:hypothetical protein
MAQIVVEQLQAYLVAQGIGQLPSSEPSLTVPSVWTQPRQGAPMPRKPKTGGDWLERATVTLNDPQVTGPPGIAAWLEDTFVDVTVRSVNAGEGKLLHRTIAGILVPIGKVEGRKHWQMGGLLVQESRIWRREQALPSIEGGETYDRVASYIFRCARSDLAA